MLSMCSLQLVSFTPSHEYNSGHIPWQDLQELLAQQGEKLDKADLETYLSALLGDAAHSLKAQEMIDGSMFASKFLGFEDAS